MNFKNILMSAALLAGSLTAAAQETKTEIDYVPNWYVGAQIGGQYTLGEVSFGDLLSPNAQILVGYNFNPVLGLRLGVNAWQSKGGWDSQVLGEQNWKWNYVAPNVDLTVNLTNLICGYKPERVCNVGIFGGLGANIGFGNDEAWNLTWTTDSWNGTAITKENQNLSYRWDGTKVRFQGRVGANIDFRLTDHWQLGAEVSANVLNDHYNSKKADNADWYFNAGIGVKYTIGKSYNKRTVEVPAPEPKVIERIVEKVVEPATASNLSEKKMDANEAERLRIEVFFTISSTAITQAEALKVQEIVNYLNKYPKASVEVTGYADKGTGKAEGNMRLSQKRRDVVVEALKKAGINPSRIKADAKGDTVQPFDINNLNRVTICIAQ